MEKEKQKTEEKLEQLARQVLQLSINTLSVDLRYLRTALQQLKLAADSDIILATDGEFLFYQPRHILRRYKSEPASSIRDHLHVVLHCIFRHMYFADGMVAEAWNLACDIAVEHMIGQLDLRSAAALRQKAQLAVLAEIEGKVGPMTAEKIYRWLLGEGASYLQKKGLAELFYADHHGKWYKDTPSAEADQEATGEETSAEGSSEAAQEYSACEEEDPVYAEAAEQKRREERALMETVWADLAREVEVELQMGGAQKDRRTDALTQNLLAVNREKYDYGAFLRKFAVRSEVMQIDPDEFDYIFYTYGLQLYGKVPLIEPLEYKEIQKIRSFVVAIDTSGSTTGQLVQRFIQKTYNILQSTENFFSKIELYILQCDDEVREAVHITSPEGFENYIQTMKIYGHGGTDFRPVFSYVDDLRRRGELQDLKGLIYFTDGYGTFPATSPDYETAFVFVDDGYSLPEVPPWAIRLVLRPEEMDTNTTV